MRKIAIGLFVFCLVLMMLAICILPASALIYDSDMCVNETGWWNATGEFNASSTSIQAAIDNATAGNTIYVYNGSYTENVIVDKQLTLRGEGADVVNVTASSTSDHVYNVTADYVNISGFNVTGATGAKNAGIYLSGRQHCNISNNIASGNNYSIYLSSSSNNTLTNNTADSNIEFGIFLYPTSNFNTITNNTASNNRIGIYLSLSSNFNTLTNNTADQNTDYGIFLYDSSNFNTLTNNTASNNKYGIILYGSNTNNMLLSNTANSNTIFGIYLRTSSSNTIYNNYFNNTNNADDDGDNIWNTTPTTGTNIIGGSWLGGNYWSDYTGADTNGDGLGEVPYNSGISIGDDYHPLVMLDNTPPAGITYLDNITYEPTYINWTWTDPLDSDFSKVMVYLDDEFKKNVTGVHFYNATSLTSGTSYELSTRTVDTSGNINLTWVNHTATTAPTSDITPPAGITDLDNITYAPTYINWTWTDPLDSDFSKVMVYLDDEFKKNVTGVHFYNATSLTSGTSYELSTRTVDTSGNINLTWVNHTATTAPTSDITPPAGIKDLDNITYAPTYINWTWTDPLDSDFSKVMVYLDDEFKKNVTGVHFYNATSLTSGTSYELSTRTVDTSGNINLTWVNHTATTAPTLDITPPAGIKDLDNITYAPTYINWTWTDPLDSDFSKVMVYLDDEFKKNVTGVHFYNATSLTSGTSYELGTRTVDTSGNINLTWVNHTATTAPTSDITPPASITDLDNITYAPTYINWTWTDPLDSDFSKVMVYLDDEFKENVTGVHFYNATSLTSGTSYELGIRTVDTSGNINLTWVNHTATTAPTSDITPPANITDLDNITYAPTYINWTWTDPLDSDFSKVMVYLDDEFKENVTSGVQCYNATSLTPSTTYEISTKTVDTTGNINHTWVNHTATTDTTPLVPDPEFVNITIDGIKSIIFANHSGSTTEGNWISLSGGDPIELPSPFTLTYNGTNFSTSSNGNIRVTVDVENNTDYVVTYPYTTHDMFTSVTGKNNVSMCFNGTTYFAENHIDVYLVNISRTSLKDAFNSITVDGDIVGFYYNLLGNPYETKLNESLDVSGDINLTFSEVNAGDYAIFILLNNSDLNKMSILSATTFQVLEYESTTTVPSEVIRGNTFNADITLTNAPTGTYTYGAVLVHENAYYADMQLKFNGTRAGTNLTLNGVDIIQGYEVLGVGLSSVNITTVLDTISDGIDAENGSVENETTSGNNTSIAFDTDELRTGNYILLTGVYNPDGKLVAFNQSEISISAPAPTPTPTITSGGGSSSSGGGSTGEEFENIFISETEREYIYMNSKVSYNFDMEGNIVRYINFTGLTNAGRVAAKVEILNHTSALVEHAPADIVYKNLNIFVGNLGWATSKNIANPTVRFEVEKSWISENNIDISTITLNRYSDDKWNPVLTTMIGEYPDYLYFESQPPGFSPFAVTGKTIGGVEVTPTETGVSPDTTPTPTEEKPGIPGFEAIGALGMITVVYCMYRRRA